MTTLILVRHGQSVGNLQGLYCGQLDFPLSEKGFVQAELTGAYLKENYRIDAIYSSDLSRAMQTAEPTAKAFGLETVPEKDLREICVGEWEGQNANEVIHKYAKEYDLWRTQPDYAPKGGETREQMQERVERCLKKILSENEGKTVAVFTHCGTIGHLFMALIPDIKARRALFDSREIYNAAVTVVHVDRGEFVDCPVFGSFEHLVGLATSTDLKTV